MWVPLVKATVGRIYRDNVIRYVVLAIIASSAILGVFVGPLVGALIVVTYTSGLVVATLLLNNAKCLQLLVDLFRTSGRASSNATDCDVCGAVRCSRHKADAAATAWQSLIVDSALDEAVTGFYSHILDSFIQSWLSQFSQDDNFVHLLKQSLRDATCRLVGRLKQLDAPLVITTRLLPCAFSHYEAVTKMLHQDAPVPMHKLALTFIMTDQPLHPAVCNRQSEIRYLRKIATCLMPKLLNADYLESKTVSSLVRELLAVWVLLPLLDVIADPNLLNLLAIVATDPPSHRQFKASSVRVPFLENFVQSTRTVDDATLVDDLLTDQSKLYNFMQFLKREGAVDVLRFHLDVEQLNQELQDPRITTDPAKLSALQQQSEQLLRHYGTMVAKVRELSEAQTLTEAHEITKRLLLGKWRRAYLKTSEHFREVYGERLVREPEDLKSDGVGVGPSAGVPATTKLSKLKGALRVGPIDAAVMSIEAVEAPTVWDAFNDPVPQNAASSLSNAAAQKSSRKERGQHMDHFMGTFMQSIEQSTDYGEDVIQMHKKRGWPVSEERESRVPGKNLVFGDLFELRKPPNGFGALNYHQHPVRGPSRCLVYILSEIVYIPWKMIIKFVIALSNISRQLVDTAVCFALQKLINMGLYEPRLAVLISLLTELLFGDKKQAEPTAAELLQRQRLARERLVAVNRQLGPLMDVLQSPAMNKHLIYTLFDIICAELFPDVLERVRAEGF